MTCPSVASAKIDRGRVSVEAIVALLFMAAEQPTMTDRGNSAIRFIGQVGVAHLRFMLGPAPAGETHPSAWGGRRLSMTSNRVGQSAGRWSSCVSCMM